MTIDTSSAKKVSSLEDAADSEEEELISEEAEKYAADSGSGLAANRWLRMLTEFIGTFLVVFLVLGGSAWTLLTGLSPVYVAFIAFVSYAVAALIFQGISGAHFNPAISLAAALTGRLNWLDALLYAIAQVLGGFAASAVMMGLIRNLPATLSIKPAQWWEVLSNGFNAADVSDRLQVGLMFAVIVVLIGTLIVVAAAMSALHEDGRASRRYAWTTALGYAAAMLVTVFFTGGGVNPARATGSAIVASIEGVEGVGADLWVFWIVPLLAGAIVGLIMVIVSAVRANKESTNIAEEIEEIEDEKAKDFEEAVRNNVRSSSKKNAAEKDLLD
ncbi:MAG: aquaporin [Aeriscardovia sp.]|nr:aquaporin [Aeriscardovia sp.]